MVKVVPKSIVTQKLSAVAATHARTEISVRDVSVVIDEPAERGGTNQGATPTESLAAALAGCINVVSHRIAESLGVELGEMRIDVASQFDRRGVMMEEALDVPFPQMDVTVHLTTKATDEEIAQVREALHKYCPLSAVIRNSGTRLVEVWNVSRA